MHVSQIKLVNFRPGFFPFLRLKRDNRKNLQPHSLGLYCKFLAPCAATAVVEVGVGGWGWGACVPQGPRELYRSVLSLTKPGRLQGRCQMKSSTWSSKLGVGRGANNPIPDYKTLLQKLQKHKLQESGDQ